MDGRALLVSALLLVPAAVEGIEPAVPLPQVIPPAAVVPPTTAVPPVAVVQTQATLTPPPPIPTADPLPTIAGTVRTVSPGKSSVFGMDLMFGQQMGIRPNVTVFSNDKSMLLVEGFYGALLTKFGGSEGAGVGMRWVTTRGGSDCVTIGPGLDVFFNFNDEQATFISPNVDIAWRHSFGERAGLVLGVNAGIGVGLSGRDDNNNNDNIAGRVTPLISFFAGLRY